MRAGAPERDCCTFEFRQFVTTITAPDASALRVFVVFLERLHLKRDLPAVDRHRVAGRAGDFLDRYAHEMRVLDLVARVAAEVAQAHECGALFGRQHELLRVLLVVRLPVRRDRLGDGVEWLEGTVDQARALMKLAPVEVFDAGPSEPVQKALV
jgi:hypothetical protein